MQIHVTDRKKFEPFVAGVRLLAKIAELYPKDFAWKKPPYEYEYEKMPIDLIAGTPKLREAVDARKGTRAFEDWAEETLEAFRKIRKKYLLYKSAQGAKRTRTALVPTEPPTMILLRAAVC